MKLSRKKDSAFVVFISKRPRSYAIYRRNARVLEMQNLIPAFMKRWTYVRTTPYRRFSQNQNFLDAQITKFSYPIVLRCAREISARTQKVDKSFRKPKIQSDTLTSQHSHTPLCLCVVTPRLYMEKSCLLIPQTRVDNSARACQEEKITQEKFLRLSRQIIRYVLSAHHKSFISEKQIFVSFKQRPNKNLYFEYSRTYDFWRVVSLLIRQLNFTQNDLCETSDKKRISISISIKLGFQILYAVEQFS